MGADCGPPTLPGDPHCARHGLSEVPEAARVAAPPRGSGRRPGRQRSGGRCCRGRVQAAVLHWRIPVPGDRRRAGHVIRWQRARSGSVFAPPAPRQAASDTRGGRHGRPSTLVRPLIPGGSVAPQAPASPPSPARRSFCCRAASAVSPPRPSSPAMCEWAAGGGSTRRRQRPARRHTSPGGVLSADLLPLRSCVLVT